MMSNDADLLGVSLDVSPMHLKARFRHLARIHHPDHGGDPVFFDRLRQAYERLQARIEARPCEECEGLGSVRVGRGFNQTRQVCPLCRGVKP